MDNKLSPAQLSSYANTSTPVVQTSGLLSRDQLVSYASQHATSTNDSNPASSVGSSWDAFDKAVVPAPTVTPQSKYGAPLIDQPMQANPNPSLSDIPAEIGKIGINLATAPLRVAKDVGYNIPSQVGTLIGEQGANKAMENFSTSLVDTEGKILKPFANFGQYLLGSLSAGVHKLTGSAIDPNAESALQNAATKVKDVVSDPKRLNDFAIETAQSIQKFVVEHPEQIVAMFDGANQSLTKLRGTPTDVVSSVAKPLIDETKNITSDVGTLVKDKVSSMIPEAKPVVINEESILDKYNRAIKPTVTGKSNEGQIMKSNKQTVSGLQSIAENKPNLTFTDADGNIIKGESPKTVDQLSQSIQQTKASIYKQYDALAKQAGEKGVAVDAPTIAKELDPVIESKSLAIANPEAITYAKSLQARLNSTGGIDAETAQEVIQHYNDSLKAFYRNPSYDTASKASIDAMIANKFRENLDSGITGATGEQYQALKNKYGALSSMEKDVAHRNVVWGRQNGVGLATNLSNIASGAELVRGLITMNPVDIAVSGTIKGIQQYMKYLNNPDVGVSKIFSELDKANPSSKGSMLVSEAKDTVKPASPESTTFAPKSQTVKAIMDWIKNPKAGLSVQSISQKSIAESVLSHADEIESAMNELSKNGLIDLNDIEVAGNLKNLKISDLTHEDIRNIYETLARHGKQDIVDSINEQVANIMLK